MKCGPYKVHPVASIFPLMDDEAIENLAEDIKTNGLLEPIVISSDKTFLIDGRNRWHACTKADVSPTFRYLDKDLDETRIANFIMSKNLARRDLNQGQRALIVLEAAPLLEKAAKERQRAAGGAHNQKEKALLTNSSEAVADQLAKLANVGGGTIRQAQKVKKISEELVNKVMSGELSLNDANKKAKAKAKNDAESEPRKTSASKKTNNPTIILKTHEGESVSYKYAGSKSEFNRTNDHISWAAWSWNPVTGCLHGCKYCYARELATRKSYADTYPVGFTPLFHHERLSAPENTKIPKDVVDDSRLGRVFVCSMADLYGKWVPNDWIEQVHKSCIENPQWEYLMLTKFPRRYVGLNLPKTAWLGTSVDEQKRVRLAEEAFKQITNVKVKWLSLEPLLAPLEFSDLSMFDWIVIGSQTETEQPDGVIEAFAPPFEWVSRLVDQAHEAGCKVYLKPNLLGQTNPQSPGMKLIQESPKVD